MAAQSMHGVMAWHEFDAGFGSTLPGTAWDAAYTHATLIHAGLRKNAGINIYEKPGRRPDGPPEPASVVAKPCSAARHVQGWSDTSATAAVT